ncbi:tRNA lysidine(34) synthetase TilS [Arthrospiribacter ruber]|uniref:tRNA(Ile)-lysidine synthase n=1 Tax=Arthrospiribacter ruber TaxID=2487934 RepID=A0A951IWE6_9BACT|nr:tRNA lysidine(34) synthetase TilS [Arthrospiribacter ruber]MBW3467149.1 tRNA lysidine(34) synthetase TilS [Arthrospiribacter ruber]
MVERFIQHIRTKNLLDENNKYLLAISGGADSVCLGQLLFQAGIDFEMAHVNFRLRGEESDGDEAFVRHLGKIWSKTVHVEQVDPEVYKEKNSSTQMIARKIRYEWFRKLAKERGLEAILTAHHFEDQLETIMLNLLRGTGIEGVFGMAERKEELIRPLLPFHKIELENYLIERAQPWRMDSSNEKSDYKRNFLRNEVFPLILEKFPSGLESMDQSFHRIKDTGKAFFQLYGQWKKEHVQFEGENQYLPMRILEGLHSKSSMLYYWLRDYGFNTADVEDLLKALEEGHSGKVFQSDGYFLNLDREYIILSKNDFEWEPVELLSEDIAMEFKFGHYDILQMSGKDPLDKDPWNAMLDKDKLSFPLILRKWELGDKFMPLGMKKEKKISDFLIDLKIPMVEKRKIAVLESNGEIVWVVGHRISDRFKCSKESNRILYFKRRFP